MASLPYLEDGTSIANRYRVLRLLGTGGMAAVYEALDTVSRESVAVKRLLPQVLEKRDATLLFRREYNVLTELSHPLIIRVFDYGLDGQIPYYTMELVPGDNLQALAPISWQRASAFLADIASALAILHSRGLVHRDVTARNVRCTAAGRAKLLDFGSLAPMGVAQNVTGTAPFVAPESLAGRPLDARVDLFSLGALAYYLLCGKHAYPATCLAELSSIYNRRIEPPSSMHADIPRALDTLVLSLLSLNPLARPESAAEVCDRLQALAGPASNDAHEIARAYLVTPKLVGRESALARFRRRLLRAEHGRGSTLLIRGEGGSGRSRLLAALTIEAKLGGMLAVSVAAGTERGPLSSVRALQRRLAELEPRLADSVSAETAGASQGIDHVAIANIAEWFVSLSSTTGLLLGIDDLEQCDDESLSVLALLVEAASSRRMLLLFTAGTQTSHPAAQRFSDFAGSLVLRRFKSFETLELLGSVFGDIPQLENIADWVHRLADGNVRTTLDLVRYLVDAGVAHYEHGGWVISRVLDAVRLPANLDQALDEKILGLSAAARELGQLLALTAEHEPLVAAEYPSLVDESRRGDLANAVEELVSGRLLVCHGDAHDFAHQAARRAFQRSIPDGVASELHRRLAAAYASGADAASVLAAYHLLRAGDRPAAFAAMIDFISKRTGQFVRGKTFVRTPAGTDFVEQLFEWGSKNGAVPSEVVTLGRVLLQLAAVADWRLVRHAPAILGRLERETGLLHWDELGHVDDLEQRIRLCVARAFKDWEATPEHERGLRPDKAVECFAVCTATLAGAYARAYDTENVVQLIPAINRLRPLSPAVDLVANVVAYTANARQGWSAREIRRRVLDRLANPVPGIDEITRVAIRMHTLYYQALEEAVNGDRAGFQRVAELEEHAPYVPLAWQVRMIAHLFQGLEKQAEICRKKRDVALIGRLDTDQQLETSLGFEATAHIILGDLMSLKRIAPVLEERSARWPGWKPLCLLVQGTYEAIRGNSGVALELSQQALALIRPGRHATWLLAVNRVVRLLLQNDRAGDAYELASSAFAESDKHPFMRPYVDMLEMALALTEAWLGRGEIALQRARELVGRAEKRGTTGILLIELYVAQAQAAELLEDKATFDEASQKIAAMCAQVDSVAFATKLSGLLKMPLGAGFEPVAAATGKLIRGNRARIRPAQSAAIRTELELCRGAAERAERVLDIVLSHSRIKQGFLYLNRPEGPTLIAARSNVPPPLEIEEHLLKCVSGSSDSTSRTTAITDRSGLSFSERYALLKIATLRDGRIWLVALAVLDCSLRNPRHVEEPVLDVMAQALLDAGDSLAI